MKKFPVLETKNLILRQLTEDDANDVFNYFSKDDVFKYYNLNKFTKLKQAERLIKHFNKQFFYSKHIRWGISLKKNNKIIGSCGYHHCDFNVLQKFDYKAEIGYELTPEYWRKGIMTEALKEIIKYGFKELKLNRIEALIIPENIASRKLVEKVGFIEEGLLKEYRFENNIFNDYCIYAILKKNIKIK